MYLVAAQPVRRTELRDGVNDFVLEPFQSLKLCFFQNDFFQLISN